MNRFAWPEAVVVLSSRKDVVAGLHPAFVEHWQGPHLVEWQEGGHVRSFELASLLIEDEGHFKFRDTEGETHELLPMTLELYEKHVRARTVGHPNFQSLRELVAAMRREW